LIKIHPIFHVWFLNLFTNLPFIGDIFNHLLIEIDDRKNLRLKNLEFVRMFQIPNPLACPYDVSEDM